MKKKNKLAIIIALVIILNTTIVVLADQTKTNSSRDYDGNMCGTVSASIFDSSLGKHRARTYSVISGSDVQASTEGYLTIHRIGIAKKEAILAKSNGYDFGPNALECTKHGYFWKASSEVETNNKDGLVLKVSVTD